MNMGYHGRARIAWPIFVFFVSCWSASQCLCAEDAKEANKKKMEQKVSFEFVDKPLADAVKFISEKTNVAISIDPEVLKNNPPAINLRVTDMTADLALQWILKLAELDSTLGAKGIVVSKPKDKKEK